MNQKKLEITEVKNGYTLLVSDDTKGGIYVYKTTEEFKMLEDVAKILTGTKVEVVSR